MNGALLNIWRETGAYLRYADTKCVLFAGLSAGLLFSLWKWEWKLENPPWGVISGMSLAEVGWAAWVSAGALVAAFLLTTSALLPALSQRAIQLGVLRQIGTLIGWDSAKRRARSIVYFADIASFDSAESYEKRYREIFDLGGESEEGDRMLIEQIWVIARITQAKFVAVNMATWLILIGTAFAIW